MATPHDTPSGPVSSPIRDQRSTPRGVLPRQLQMWLMVGLAVLILAIILVTGRTTPAPRPVVGAKTGDPSALAPDRIQAYQRQLAEDEARVRRQLAQPAAPPRGATETVPGSRDMPPADPLADEQRRREYQSLFADNVAFSRRTADASSSAPHPAPTPAGNTPLAAAPLSPQDVGRLAALLLARPETPAPTVAPGTASGPGLPSPEARAATSSAVATPHETGPVQSTDARERLSEGTIIETVLINRLNGAFAGPLACLVTTPVYSHDRQRVVIPAGARVLGAAAPVQTWGDSRLAVSFHRLVMPDGRTYSLDQFKGLDQIGATGLRDEVNRHYLQVFGASVAIGALSGLAQYGTTAGFGPTSFGDQYRQASGASLATSTGHILDRYLNVLPTLTIREGYRIKVYLTNDLDLPAIPSPISGGVQ